MSQKKPEGGSNQKATIAKPATPNQTESPSMNRTTSQIHKQTHKKHPKHPKLP